MGPTMKAVVFHGKGDLRYQDVPKPECRKGFVMVKPAWCGICGSDLHEYLDGPTVCPTTPHAMTGETMPITMGHEFSGTVEEIGEGVQNVKVGDRVCVEPIIWDGNCQSCNANMHNCCDKGGFIGLSGWGGGLSEHVVVPAASLYKLPDSISFEVGALIEPLAVAWHAVDQSPVKTGDSVLVLGGGPIGLAIIQCLKTKHPNKIIVSEMASKRKEFAKDFGATHILDPMHNDIVAECRKLTNGQGVDVVYDAAGVQKALDQAFDALRVRGTIVSIALWGSANINPLSILLKEKKYQGTVTYTRGDFQKVIDQIAAGNIKPEGMITKKIKMDQVVEEGFAALINDKTNQVKILVEGLK